MSHCTAISKVVSIFWLVCLAALCADEPFAVAVRLIEHGRLEDARLETQRALLDNPTDPFGQSVMGVILDQLGRFSEADIYHKKAINLRPRAANVLNNAASHYLAWNRHEAAHDLLLRVIEVDPRHFQANWQLARTSQDSGDPTNALKYLQRLRRTDRERPEARLLESEALFSSGRTSDAAGKLAATINTYTTDPAVAFSAGTLYYRNGLMHDARQSFERAASLAQSNSDAHFNLGLSCYRLKDFSAAAEAFRSAWRLAPDSADAPYYLAIIHLQRNEDMQALQILLETRKLVQKKPELMLECGRALLKLRFYSDAISALEQYIRLRSATTESYKLLGMAYARDARCTDAISVLSRYLQSNPGDAEALVERARCRRRIGQTADAETDLRQSLQVDPMLAAGLLEYGVLEFELQRLARAEEMLAKATQAGNNAADYYLSLVYRRLNRQAEADERLARWQRRTAAESAPVSRSEHYIEYLQKAVQVDPRDASVRLRLCATLLDSGLSNEAIQCLETPNLPDGDQRRLALLARGYFQRRDYDRALSLIARTSSPDAELINIRARIAHQRADYRAALNYYQEAIRREPQNETFYIDLISFFIDTRATDAARTAVAAAREIFPNSHKFALVEAMERAIHGDSRGAYALLLSMERKSPLDSLQATVAGLIASSLDDNVGAIAHMQQAVALGTDDPMPYYYLAFFEFQQPEPDARSVLAWLDLALKRNPQYDDAHLLRGKVLLRAGSIDDAIASLELAAKLNASAETYYVLGRAYAKAEQPHKAEAMLHESERLRQQATANNTGKLQDQLIVRIQSGL